MALQNLNDATGCRRKKMAKYDNTCYLHKLEAEFQRRDLLPLAFEQKIVHL